MPGGGVCELRLVLPLAAWESHRRSAGGAEEGAEAAAAPRLRGVDPAVPAWAASACGGCCRLHVATTSSTGPGQVQQFQYRCRASLLPVRVVVLLDTAVVAGDCTVFNALRLKPEALLDRRVQRTELLAAGPAAPAPSGAAPAPGGACGASSASSAAVVTVYCRLEVRVEGRRYHGALAWPVLPLVRRRLEASALEVAERVLHRHWSCVARRWAAAAAQAAARSEGAAEAAGAAERPSGTDDDGGTAQATPEGPEARDRVSTLSDSGLQRCASPKGAGASPSRSREGAAGRLGPRSLEPEAEGWGGSSPWPGGEQSLTQASPSLARALLFHKGFLYKLGDGYLNTTWNLRYFLLIGQSLQYYRSQHEARPRDVFDLSEATVQWVTDQSRPFAFTVSKTGQRLLCLSGSSEEEAREWMRQIEAASHLDRASQSNPGGQARQAALPLPGLCEPLALAGSAGGARAGEDLEARMQACSQVLVRAAFGQGHRLRELREGLRITQQVTEAATPAAGGAAPAGVVALVALALPALVLLWPWGAGRAAALPCTIILASLLHALLRLVTAGRRGEAPVVCALARIEGSSEELKELLADPALYAEWRPRHRAGMMLSLAPSGDEEVYTRTGLGLCGPELSFRARRRWVRSADGMRLLCAVATPGPAGGNVSGFEGFAILPGEEGCCTVAWVCGLDFLPWAPRWLRAHLSVRYVSGLAGLREWMNCPAARTCSGPASAGVQAASMPGPHSAQLLRGFHRSPAGGLHLPHDLERAAVAAQLLLGITRQALLGGSRLNVEASPCGLELQPGADLAHRYAARCAYGPALLLDAGVNDGPRDRMVRVVAFAVAGLHLAAASYPHLPWVVWAAGAAKHAMVLPDDTRVRVDVGFGGPAAAGVGLGGTAEIAGVRRAQFEVCPGRAGADYRIVGTDEVACHAELPGSFRFVDRGVTAVEFAASGASVRFTTPDLQVRASGWTLGLGSVLQWHGASHFLDAQGGVQCDLMFGVDGADSVTGTVRDSLGTEIGRIWGSWLGPLLCDGEVLWPGPRRQPAPL